jgi:hypothetical protein
MPLLNEPHPGRPMATEEVCGLRLLLADLDLAGAVVTADALHIYPDAAEFWSPTSKPTTCSRSRPTSPPCWPAASTCPGTWSR